MSFLSGGSAKETPSPKPMSPPPTNVDPAVANRAAGERHRIKNMQGRKKSILSYGQLAAKPSILKKKLGQA